MLARSNTVAGARPEHTDDREIEVRVGPNVLIFVSLVVVNYQLLEPI